MAVGSGVVRLCKKLEFAGRVFRSVRVREKILNSYLFVEREKEKKKFLTFSKESYKTRVGGSKPKIKGWLSLFFF